ncbi:MAG: CHAT domain-containing protein, partial [Chloroflexi bacterium]
DACYDSDEYSRKLTGGFFKSQGVKSYFSSAKSSVLSRDGMGLRLRLFVGSDAPELHPLHWELLRDPDTNFLIATSQDILFSRYLSSLDWRPVRLKPKSEMQALVVVANPSDLEANHFAPIHVEAELARARQALDDIPVTAIPAGSGEHATLTKIVAKLAENEYDILYIVCHGALSGADEPVLWLEGEDGRAKKTFGKDLVVRLQELPQRPRLVVLASCESAGNSAGEALSALGPRLVEAGIPAVLAMQGKVSVQTIEQFMPRFFESVRQEGHIDQAMAVARGLVRDRPDSWMPVLFMRLKSGRLWYVPGYADEQKFDRWRALISDIEMKKVTPIIGPGTFEPLNICIRGIAERWAEAFQYPMAQYERDSIPKVAQFLSADQSATFPYAQLVSYLRSDIQKRYKNDLDESMLAPRAPLMELIDQVGARRRERNPEEAYRILAQLPFKIFVTTDTNNLLANALREAGKEPTVMLCPWNKYTAKQVANASLDEFEPDEKHPIVFHVFGKMDEPDSLVLTEDDHFDFLIGFSRNNNLIPEVVREALADSALLFLGFQMDDWGFRVLFRSILAREGGLLQKYSHVAAQFAPEEGRASDPKGAQKYLEKYFARNAQINLYWGSVDEFVKELWKRWNALPA